MGVDAIPSDQKAHQVVNTSLQGASQGPSFDCAKAATAAEKMICADSKLAAMDAEMVAAYKAGLAAAPDKEAFKKQQAEWRRNVRDTCTISRTCVEEAYQQRLGQLK